MDKAFGAMADIVNKDPFTYQKERESFLVHLRQFHSNRRTPFQRSPCVGGKDVDLYLLYLKVTSAGGADKVNDEERWDEIQGLFNIPPSCTNSSQALKNIYIRYLEVYEKVNFFGEDPDRREDDQGTRPGRKPARQQHVCGVPLSYNYKQHNVPDYMRQTYGMSSEFVTPSDYAKMEMSLLSGLPNEVDFVFNVCTLLSNRGRQQHRSLRLTDCPRLVDLLLAHVGVFAHGHSSLRKLHEEGWRPNTNRNFLGFWYESVEDNDIRDLILDDSYRPGETSTDRKTKTSDKADDGNAGELDYLFNVKRDLGVHDSEGQRVLQLAVIIRNLSFEDDNKAFLSSNWLAFRFIMLCVHDKYNCIKQLGLDMLSNVASAMVLEPVDYRTTQLILRTISRCVCSEDKFEVVSGLSIVAHLCQSELNEDVLSEHLDSQLYERVVRLLTLHDIQLIVFTLETLYQLSELGEMTTNAIAGVRFAVETLVSLVTVEAQSYGPNSLIGIKVVEHVPAGGGTSMPPPAPSQPPAPMQASVAGKVGSAVAQQQVVARVAAVATPPPSAASVQHSQQQRIMHTATPPPPVLPTILPAPPPSYKILPSSSCSQPIPRPASNPSIPHHHGESMACNWLQAYYEYGSGSVKVDTAPTRIRMYTDYLAKCGRHPSTSLVNMSNFDSCVRVAFPRVDTTKEEKEDGSTEVKYRGIRRRVYPLPFTAEGDAASSTGRITPVPMVVTNDTRKRKCTPVIQPVVQPTPPLVADDDSRGSESNLIKSLLANKVQRRQQLEDDVKTDEIDCKPARSPLDSKVNRNVTSSSLARTKPRSSPADVKYAVSRARIERLHDVNLDAAEARIEKVQNRYVALLERELERQTPSGTHAAVTSGCVQPTVNTITDVVAQTQLPTVQTQPLPPTTTTTISSPHLVAMPTQIITAANPQPPVILNGPVLCLPNDVVPVTDGSSTVVSDSTQLTPTSMDSTTSVTDDKMDVDEAESGKAELTETAADYTNVVKPAASEMAVDGEQSSDAWPSVNADNKAYMDPLEYCCKLSRISEWSPGPSSGSSENSRQDADTTTADQTRTVATDSVCVNSAAVIVPQQLIQQAQPQMLHQQLLIQQQLLQQQLLQVQVQPNLLQTQTPLLQQPLMQQPDVAARQQTMQLQPQQLLQHQQQLGAQIVQQGQQLALANGVLYPQTVYTTAPAASADDTKDMTNCTNDEQMVSSVDMDTTNCVKSEKTGDDTVDDIKAMLRKDDELAAKLLHDDKLAGLNGVIKCIGNGDISPSLTLNGPSDQMLQAKLAAIFPGKSLKDSPAIVENGFEPHNDDSSKLTDDAAAMGHATNKLSENNVVEPVNSMANSSSDKPLALTSNGLGGECVGYIEQGQGDGSGVTGGEQYVIQEPTQSSQFTAESAECNVLAPQALHAQVAQFMPAACAFGVAPTEAASDGTQQQQQALVANKRQTVAIQPTLIQQPLLAQHPPQQQMVAQEQQQQQPIQQLTQQLILAQQQALLAQQQQQAILGQQSTLAQQQPILAQQQPIMAHQPILAQSQPPDASLSLQSALSQQQPAILAPQQIQLGQQVISLQGMMAQSPAHVFHLSSDGRHIGQPRMILPNLTGQQPFFVTANGQSVQLLPTTAGGQQVLVSMPPHAAGAAVSTAQPTIMAVSLPSGYVEQQLQFVSAAGHAVVHPSKQVTGQQQQQIRLLVSQSQPVLPKPPANIAPAQIRLLPAAHNAPTPAADSRKRPLPPQPPLKASTDSSSVVKSAKKKKAVNKSSSASSVVSHHSSTNDDTTPQFMCEWAGCLRCFSCSKAVEQHVMCVHFDRTSPATICQWHACDGMRRQKWSFVQHLQERHLTVSALKASAARRKQQGSFESRPIPPAAPPTSTTASTSTATGTGTYPVDAALQAVRRFAVRPPYPEFVEVKEGPVTKHIRLTSALVLRNLARYSALGRSLIKKHEQHLAYVALNCVESSTAIANCLCEIQKH